MNLQTQLTTLESSGLIHLAQTHPELEYLFHHALMQDVAYELLLKADRKHLHLMTGLTLEKNYPERLEELAALLGHHFCLGGDDARGIKYLIMAGDVAVRVYANPEARQYYLQAIQLMQQHHPQFQAQLPEVYIKCGRMCEMSGRFDDALNTYDQMEAFAREKGDEKLELAALIARATVYCAPTSKYDAVKGESLCTEARELALQLKDRAAEAKILWNLALLNKFNTRWDKVLQYGEEAIAIARELNLRELLAYVLNDIYMGYTIAGRINLASQVLEESSGLWRELNNMAMLGDNLTGLANLQFMLGNAQRGVELADESYRLNLLMRNNWGRSYSAWVLGQVYMLTGDFEQALFFLDEAIHFGEAVGFRVPTVAARVALSSIFNRAGQSERGLKILQEAFEAGTHLPRWMPMIFGMRAQIYVGLGDLAKATEALQQVTAPFDSLDPMTRQFLVGAKCKYLLAQKEWASLSAFIEPMVIQAQRANIIGFSIDPLHYQAQAYLGLGRVTEAREILIKACTIAQTTELRMFHYPSLVALAKIEADPTEKRKWLTQARETIIYIADHSPADLRETFLQTPDVKYVLESV